MNRRKNVIRKSKLRGEKEEVKIKMGEVTRKERGNRRKTLNQKQQYNSN